MGPTSTGNNIPSSVKYPLFYDYQPNLNDKIKSVYPDINSDSEVSADDKCANWEKQGQLYPQTEPQTGNIGTLTAEQFEGQRQHTTYNPNYTTAPKEFPTQVNEIVHSRNKETIFAMSKKLAEIILDGKEFSEKESVIDSEIPQQNQYQGSNQFAPVSPSKKFDNYQKQRYLNSEIPTFPDHETRQTPIKNQTNVFVNNVTYINVQKFHTHERTSFGSYWLWALALFNLRETHHHHHHYHQPLVITNESQNREKNKETDNKALMIVLGTLGAAVLCVGAYLLGKDIAGYKNIQEDVDLFQKELEMWKFQKNYQPLQYRQDVDRVIELTDQIQQSIRVNKIWNITLIASFVIAGAACVVTALTSIVAIAILGVGIAGIVTVARLFKYGFDSATDSEKKKAQEILNIIYRLNTHNYTVKIDRPQAQNPEFQ